MADQRRQRADPVGGDDAVQEQRRPGQPLRRGGRGVPAGRQRQPDAQPWRVVNTQAIRMPGLFHRVPGRWPSRRSQSTATARGWCASALVHGADVTMPAKRKIEEIETLQAERGDRADDDRSTSAAAADRRYRSGPARSRPRRTRRRRRRTARDRPRSAPARSALANGLVFAGGAAPGHGADRKHQRSRHGMTVLRDHAVADDLRALRQVVRQNDQRRIGSTARRWRRRALLPPASMTPITAGATLSLKCNCTIFGGCVSTLPSAGSEERSVAWAHAALAMHRADSSAARPASTRAIGIALRFCDQLEARRRRLAVMAMALPSPEYRSSG